MKSTLIACLTLCLAMSVSGQCWYWWCFPIYTVSNVYFVPNGNVTTGKACAAAAPNATLTYGTYALDTTLLQVTF